MATKKTTAAKKAVSEEPKNPVPVRFIIAGAPDVPVRLSLARKGDAKAMLIAAGEEVSLVPGRYAVVGQWSPNWDRRVFCGYVYSTPPFSVDCSVVVPKDGGDVVIMPQMRCFALVPEDGCESYLIRGYDGYMSKVKTPCFISGSWSHPALTVATIQPNSKQSQYELVSAETEGCFAVENGKWYAFGQNGVKSGDIVDGMPGGEDSEK